MSLFSQLIDATGLSTVIAQGVLERALLREGVTDPENLRRSQLFAARHVLRDALSVYLSIVELNEAMSRIEQLCRTTSSMSSGGL